MSQKHKNTTLLVILGLLVSSSIILELTGETSINTIENKEIFSVQDTSIVDFISIKSIEEDIQLKKVESTWSVNEKYKAEQNIVQVLLSILKDAEVIRNVPKTQAEDISKNIMNNGYLIEISGNGKLINSFYSSGNANKTVSYMMPVENNNPMIVNIPGYESYVAGIFEIPANDWRDRVILRTNWRTLQKLRINYAEYPEYNLNIKFDFNFLKIEGITHLDTARMMAFIDEFNYVQTDRYLDKGQNEKYDSLLQTPPTVSLTIEDINSKNSKSIDFFPIINNDPMMLGYVKEDDQIVLFEAQRIQNLFAIKSDFEVKLNGN
ncbi:MAG: hypothetical protein KAI99_09625 [Cyclobacteriaceae bacterium]|nr:hypothetical protein [Cyclobacteriaceae bacterium]